MRLNRGVAGTDAPGETSDAELLAAHIAGDTSAFAVLVRRHYDHLWLTARRASYSAEDAADAMQEALLSAHRTAASFRADSAVRSWLHRIVVNACLDRLRRNKVRPTIVLPDDGVINLKRWTGVHGFTSGVSPINKILIRWVNKLQLGK